MRKLLISLSAILVAGFTALSAVQAEDAEAQIEPNGARLWYLYADTACTQWIGSLPGPGTGKGQACAANIGGAYPGSVMDVWIGGGLDEEVDVEVGVCEVCNPSDR